MNAKNVRIKDIAKLSGVSVGTVDRVLHNRGKVSEKALNKVLKVLDQIDYQPNVIARTLGANKTYRIAAVIPDPKQDPYWAYSKAGIEQAQAEWLRYGVKVVPYFFDLYKKTSFRQAAEAVAADLPDGILIAPIFYHETLPYFERFRSIGLPYVLFNTNIEDVEALSFIGQDLFQSGKVAGELMQLALRGESSDALGVLHVNEVLENSVHLAEKERGFREYFRDQADVEVITLNPSNLSESGLSGEIMRLLDESSVKGLFSTTSAGTSIIASALERNNRQDIKLVGYDMLEDNIRYMKKGVIDFLINQNPKRQASLGINHLVNHLIMKKPTPAKDLLPLEIISPENIGSYLGDWV